MKDDSNFKQTDIGLIPEDWEIRKIEDSFSFTKKPRNLEINDNVDVPFIPMEMIPDNRTYVEDFELKKFGSFSSGTYFENGDILLAKITPSFENGKQAIARIPYDFGYATTEVIPINEIENTSSKYFLFNYLFKKDIRTILAGKMEGSTGRQRLPKTVLQNTLIPLPPLSEQKKIAHILSKIQQAIETQEKIIKTTQELKKALMQKLFTEGLNSEAQKQTEIGLIPESWEVKEFINYVILQRGKDLPKTKFEVGDIPVAGSNGIIGYHSISFAKAPGLTVGRSGSCGIVTFYEKDFWAHNTVLYAKDFKENHPLYVFYHLQYVDLSRFKSGVSVPTLNRNSFSSLKVGIPSIKEQKNIAHSLVQLDRKIEFQEVKSNQLKSLFSSTLNQLMTGQIRVKDIEFEIVEPLEELEV